MEKHSQTKSCVHHGEVDAHNKGESSQGNKSHGKDSIISPVITAVVVIWFWEFVSVVHGTDDISWRVLLELELREGEVWF